jgi:hypothetical protein
MADAKHNPGWFGNQWYGGAFGDVDAGRQQWGDPTGKAYGIKQPIDWHELDMEKNLSPTQQWAPAPMINPTSIGWNKVASASPVQMMAQMLRGSNA